DTIANALYKWYKRVAPNDSILVDTTASFNIPYLLPPDTGRYLCKVIVNNGCLERVANYTLTGYCGVATPVKVTLDATKQLTGNQVRSANHKPVNTYEYFLERSADNFDFRVIGSWPANTRAGNIAEYSYLD